MIVIMELLQDDASQSRPSWVGQDWYPVTTPSLHVEYLLLLILAYQVALWYLGLCKACLDNIVVKTDLFLSGGRPQVIRG